MTEGPLLLSLFTLALLLPVMYRRHQRRTGAIVERSPQQNRKGRLAVAAVASLLVVGSIGGAAYASNGDPNGSQTGTDASALVPAGSDHTTPTPEIAATTSRSAGGWRRSSSD